jgi:hypothetical protein
MPILNAQNFISLQAAFEAAIHTDQCLHIPQRV